MLHGAKAGTRDAFLYGNTRTWPACHFHSARPAQLLWAKGLFFPENGIAAGGQAPIE